MPVSRKSAWTRVRKTLIYRPHDTLFRADIVDCVAGRVQKLRADDRSIFRPHDNPAAMHRLCHGPVCRPLLQHAADGDNADDADVAGRDIRHDADYSTQHAGCSALSVQRSGGSESGAASDFDHRAEFTRPDFDADSATRDWRQFLFKSAVFGHNAGQNGDAPASVEHDDAGDQQPISAAVGHSGDSAKFRLDDAWLIFVEQRDCHAGQNRFAVPFVVAVERSDSAADRLGRQRRNAFGASADCPHAPTA